MIDNIKFICTNPTIIQRLKDFPDAKPYHHKFNTYNGFEIKGKLMRLDFRKSFESGIFAGYHHLEISISPHYHFNNYNHNGNDLKPLQAQKTIKDILNYLTIEDTEFDQLQVVNLEYGLNIIPATDIKKIISGISFSKKTTFLKPIAEFPFYKITDATKSKRLKAYAKGLQFADFPKYNINKNVFRFEIKNKKSAPIRKHGINTANDLFKDEVYIRLAHTICAEWQNILIINLEPNFALYKRESSAYLREHSRPANWLKIISDKNRNKFHREKLKYFNLLHKSENLLNEISILLNDKIVSFGIGAYLPQRKLSTKDTETTTAKKKNKDLKPISEVQVSPHAHVIKCKSAPLPLNLRKCIVTNINISMQKDESKFLFTTGLKYYRDNEPEIYENVLRRFWSVECKGKKDDDLHKTIAHNIRNKYNNNRYRIEKNISPDQLPLF